MKKTYRSELVGAFGCPIDENPTGIMEEAAFREKHLDYRYLTIKVEPQDIEAAMKAVRAFQMRGINLTIPHKVNAVKYVDELSQAAEIIGAINVVVNNNGKLWADNTDGKGFLTALNDVGEDPKGKHITVLGAGGAARAISVECALAGARQITIFNIVPEQGRALCQLLNDRTAAKADFVLWDTEADIPDDTDILVNATCVGLYPNVDQRPNINYNTVTSDMVVCDVIFNDPNSRFLQAAAINGAKTVNGLGMLVNQGALNFKLWTGVEAPKEIMRQTLKKEFGLI